MAIKQISKVPLLQALNNHRRRIIESKYFDFLLNPLISRLERHPPILILDTTNHCNAKCSWCHNPDLKYPKGVMSQKLFEKIIRDYAQYKGDIWFATFGEPFMDKNILNRIEFTRKFDSIENITILTNALLLSSDNVKRLIDLKVDIEISLDEINKDMFETVKQIDFDKVIKNILFLLDANQRTGSPIRVIIRMKTLQTEKEVKEAKLYQQIKELGAYVDLTPVATSDSIANWGGNFDKSQFFKNYFPGLTLNGNYKNYNVKNNAPCSQLWRNLVVMWDGKVVLCCVDMEGKVVLGDLNKNSILEIWKGEKIETVRKLFKNRSKSKIPLCKKCDLHQGWQYLRKYFNSTGSLYKNNFFK